MCWSGLNRHISSRGLSQYHIQVLQCICPYAKPMMQLQSEVLAFCTLHGTPLPNPPPPPHPPFPGPRPWGVHTLIHMRYERSCSELSVAMLLQSNVSCWQILCGESLVLPTKQPPSQSLRINASSSRICPESLPETIIEMPITNIWTHP